MVGKTDKFKMCKTISPMKSIKTGKYHLATISTKGESISPMFPTDVSSWNNRIISACRHKKESKVNDVSF